MFAASLGAAQATAYFNPLPRPKGCPVFLLVCVSAAVTWFTRAELHALLASCRAHNAQAGSTGMLLYRDGNFMQALDGEESAVRALQARIGADLRHRGMVVIDSGPAEHRQFADWRMGFVDLTAAQDGLPPGYSRFLDLPLTEQALCPHPGPLLAVAALVQAARLMAGPPARQINAPTQSGRCQTTPSSFRIASSGTSCGSAFNHGM